MKTRLLGFIMTMLSLALLGCKEDSTWLVKTTDGPMTVTRIADPKNWDATITKGALDQLIKIEGTNLNNVKTIFINDVEAEKPTDMLPINGAIFIRIPYVVPIDVDNKIKITDKMDRTIEVPFEVTIPDLVIEKMDCEYTPAGASMVISGNYLDLYNLTPENGTVKFGNIEAPIVSGNKTSIVVVVPNNVPDNTTVTLESDKILTTCVCPGKYKDKEYLLHDFNYSRKDDGTKVCYITGPEDPNYLSTDPMPLSGGYMRYFNTYVGGWAWQGFEWPLINNKPADLATNAASYAIKFECYAVYQLQDPILMIIPISGGQSNYRWGGDKTFSRGKWLTYSIPITETVADISSWVNASQAQFVFHAGGTGLESYWCIDNVRISKIK